MVDNLWVTRNIPAATWLFNCTDGCCSLRSALIHPWGAGCSGSWSLSAEAGNEPHLPPFESSEAGCLVAGAHGRFLCLCFRNTSCVLELFGFIGVLPLFLSFMEPCLLAVPYFSMLTLVTLLIYAIPTERIPRGILSGWPYFSPS